MINNERCEKRRNKESERKGEGEEGRERGEGEGGGGEGERDGSATVGARSATTFTILSNLCANHPPTRSLAREESLWVCPWRAPRLRCTRTERAAAAVNLADKQS